MTALLIFLGAVVLASAACAILAGLGIAAERPRIRRGRS